MSLEGVVSKKLDAPYRSGKGATWTKAKCRAGHEVVIGGWTTTGDAFRSLIVGIYNDEGQLAHVGRVGTGFSRDKVGKLLPALKRLARKTSPFGGRGSARGCGNATGRADSLATRASGSGARCSSVLPVESPAIRQIECITHPSADREQRQDAFR